MKDNKCWSKQLHSSWCQYDIYVFYTACFQKLTSWAIWITNFYDVISSRCNVTPCCNITSWRHIPRDGCLQTPIISDYQFNSTISNNTTKNNRGQRLFPKITMPIWISKDPNYLCQYGNNYSSLGDKNLFGSNISCSEV